MLSILYNVLIFLFFIFFLICASYPDRHLTGKTKIVCRSIVLIIKPDHTSLRYHCLGSSTSSEINIMFNTTSLNEMNTALQEAFLYTTVFALTKSSSVDM